MGLLTQVADDLGVSVADAGLLISGYALGVFVGAPLLTLAAGRLPRKAVLVGLMIVFTFGNLACALAPDYATLMAARVVTSLARGVLPGVGAVVATGLDARSQGFGDLDHVHGPDRRDTARRAGRRRNRPALRLARDVLGRCRDRHRRGCRDRRARAARLRAARGAPRIASELAAVAKAPVLLGLGMTVLGFAGVFTVYTYIEPILLQVTRVSATAVSPVLLVFGVGMILGNLFGGRLADRRLATALLVTLAALAIVLAALGLVMTSAPAMVAATGLLGVAAFATPCRRCSCGCCRRPATRAVHRVSANIGAFNLGNALGAWLGGLVIVHGGGLAGIGWAASIVTLAGLGVAVLAIRSARTRPAAPHEACATA